MESHDIKLLMCSVQNLLEQIHRMDLHREIMISILQLILTVMENPICVSNTIKQLLIFNEIPLVMK